MKLQRALAEAEMTAAYFGLGKPPRVGQSFRSADGFDDPITPGGVSARGTREDLPGAILFRHFVATALLVLHKLSWEPIR